LAVVTETVNLADPVPEVTFKVLVGREQLAKVITEASAHLALS
jgi:hypothetical protein